jgi:TolB-like protein/Tfp pilus assembly protein PilF
VRYSFGDFELDTERFELLHRGQTRHVEPQVFDLLRFLASRPDRVVTRDELREHVWKARFVSDTTISTCLKAARKALGDDGRTQSILQTVRGRGVRLVADVYPAELTAPAITRRRTEVVLAVLPFGVLSEEVRFGFFAEGVTEDLTATLAHVPGLTVISGSSSAAFRGAVPPLEKVRAALGVTHLVLGNVRPLGPVVRISVRLVDAQTEVDVWSERFDRPVDQLFELHDDVLRAISRRIEPRLTREIYARTQLPGADTDAWEVYHRAQGLLAVKGWRAETFDEAATLLRHTVRLDPTYARAHAALALLLGFGWRVGRVLDRELERVEALTAAERALELDDTDSAVLGWAGCALVDLHFPDRGLLVLERAVEIDPSNAHAWAALGAARIDRGPPARAAEALRHGIRISPLDNRLAVWGAFLARALLLDGRTDDALAEAESACRHDPQNHLSQLVHAEILLRAGRDDEARRARHEALRLRPEITDRQIADIVGPQSLEDLRALGGESRRPS